MCTTTAFVMARRPGGGEGHSRCNLAMVSLGTHCRGAFVDVIQHQQCGICKGVATLIFTGSYWLHFKP